MGLKGPAARQVIRCRAVSAISSGPLAVPGSELPGQRQAHAHVLIPCGDAVQPDGRVLIRDHLIPEGQVKATGQERPEPDSDVGHGQALQAFSVPFGIVRILGHTQDQLARAQR